MEELLCSHVNCGGQTGARLRRMRRPVGGCVGVGSGTSWVCSSERLVYLLDCGGNSLRVEMDSAERQTQA